MEERKEQILEAARQLFIRQGYSKTSVDDISQAVGMKKSSLYYYFSNKEELFLTANKSEWYQNLQQFKSKALQESDPAKRILHYVKSILGYYETVVVKNNIPVRVIIETRNLFRQWTETIQETNIKFYQECIQLGIDEGTFESCNTKEVAESINLVKFSIQYDQMGQFLNEFPTKEDFKKIEQAVLYPIQLMINGLKK